MVDGRLVQETTISEFTRGALMKQLLKIDLQNKKYFEICLEIAIAYLVDHL